MTYITFAILGLGSGAVFAALALSLVVTYRSSGVINFATGAIALYVAYSYAYLRNGYFLNPLPFMKTSITLPFTPGFWVALLMALAEAGIIGMGLYLLVFRHLRSAPVVAKAVASLGILVIFQNLLAQKVGTSPVTTAAIFPSGVVTIDGTNVRVAVLLLAATIVAVTILLWLFFRYTRFGLATRAVAESEKGALVTGLSPERIGLANWAISTMVAGLAGILIAPIIPLVPVSYTLYVVPALAAALIAGLSSLPVAVAAGLFIGAADSVIAYVQSDQSISWLTIAAASSLVPLALIMIYLVFRGRPLPARGALILQTLGRAPRPRTPLLTLVLGAVVGVVVLLATTGNVRFSIETSMIFAV
ncbi:MAG TPA: branched-chain amino acid ABC transporter permease, partial [Acidimicrobiales bacterium]|nr:branched-chain amino acid ABC transporter permease [Acidimicrobiales bacterium]